MDPGVKIALGKLPGRDGHVVNGLGLLHGGGGGGHKADQQHRNGRHAENTQKSPPHLRHGSRLHDGQYRSGQGRPIRRRLGGNRHHKPGLIVEPQVYTYIYFSPAASFSPMAAGSVSSLPAS